MGDAQRRGKVAGEHENDPGDDPVREQGDPQGGMQGVWWALHSPAQGALLEACLAAVSPCFCLQPTMTVRPGVSSPYGCRYQKPVL